MTARMRIIPAHAGLTLIGCVAKALQGDHPRACGAHRRKREIGGKAPGSSPRMRGSPAIQNAFGSDHGIIPAHAGLTPPI